MKYIMTLAVALAALASTAFGQVATNELPALTNSVQFVWSAGHVASFTALLAEDFNARMAAWVVATNANPSYATTNSVPVKGGLPAFIGTFTKNAIGPVLGLADAQRQWRANNQMATAYAQAQSLFSQAWALLTPTQQATQSNVWWTAWSATQ